MRRQQQLLHQHQQPQTRTQTQRRGRTYLKIILILIIQAIVLPWFVMEQGEDGSIMSQNAGNPPPSLLLRSNNKGSNSNNNNNNNRDKEEKEEADGTFNSFPIYLKHHHHQHQAGPSFHSNLHCIGDTHDKQTSWMYRSCQFHNLCIDTTAKEFVFIESQTLRNLHSKTQQLLNNNNNNNNNNGVGGSGFFSSTSAGGVGNNNNNAMMMNSTSTTTTNTNSSSSNNNNNNNFLENNMAMALGGINPRWDGNGFNQGRHKVKWFPKTLQTVQEEELPPSSSKVYELDPNIILLPFHSFAAHNVGHLLWDDFLPIFTLLEIFDYIPQLLQQQSKQLLLLRVDTLPLLYGTCEMRKNKQQKCKQNFHKFLPLLGITNPVKQFTTLKNIQFEIAPSSSSVQQQKEEASSSSSSSLVCAKTAIAGLGMLTDHGMNDHGWYPETDTRVHNTAKGQLLYRFRNFMLTNIGLPIVPLPPLDDNGQQQQQQFRILLSQHSSGDGPRDVSMENQYNAIQRAFPPTPTATTTTNKAIITTRVVNLATIQSLEEQILLVSQKTNIFISTTGGGSMTATFLPKGSTLILFYQKYGGFDFHNFNFTGGPAYLDYDLFNNMSYIRVHWLPIETMDTKEGLDTLIALIQYEMEVYYDNSINNN